MNLSSFHALINNDYSELVSLIENNTFETQLQSLKTYYNNPKLFLKKTFSMLATLYELENDMATKNNSPPKLNHLKLLIRGIILVMIKPLIDNLKKTDGLKVTSESLSNAQLLAKWWLSLLNQTLSLRQTQTQWNAQVDVWFSEFEHQTLQESIQVLEGFYHWRILLLRGYLLFARPGFILEAYCDVKLQNAYFQEITEMFSNHIEKEIESAYLREEETKRFGYQTLQALREILRKADDADVQTALLRGKFKKQDFGLPHSVILGWDGGIYAQLNSVNEQELEILQNRGVISNDFAVFESKNKDAIYKIVIRNARFGKFRLGTILKSNENSPTIKPGEIVCLKKIQSCHNEKHLPQRNSLSNIIEQTWNDYTLNEMSHFPFFQNVYDMAVVGDLLKEQKGYTIQEFVHLLDCSKVFKIGRKLYQQWSHVMTYLISVFQSVSNLLPAGIFLTDMKLENTLYDPENGRCMLIDSASVVQLGSAEYLDDPIDLIHNAIYSLCNFIQNFVLNLKEAEFQTQDYLSLNKFVEDSLFAYNEFEKKKTQLSIQEAMKILQEMIQEGLKILQEIQTKDESLRTEKLREESLLKLFMKNLVKNTMENLAKYGLNPELSFIKDNYIQLLGSKINPEIDFKKLDLEDLQKILQEFLDGEATETSRVFVLLGSAGSGKSTILQLKYLNALVNWKENDAIPIFIDLAAENDLNQRWKFLNSLMDQKLSLKIFTGIRQYPVTLFIDSFDESLLKINYVNKFFKELGNNKANRCLICCRSEYVQKEQDCNRWFSSETPFVKWYIVPLFLSGFNLEKYAKDFYSKKYDESLTNENIEKIIATFQDHNLKTLLNTCYMVHLSLDVISEIFCEKKKISWRLFYEKSLRKNIEKVLAKKNEIRLIFNKKYGILEDNGLFEFVEESAKFLAQILHKIQSLSLTFTPKNLKLSLVQEFLDRHHYKLSNTCLENKCLEALIRMLNLHVEVRGEFPREEIKIGFGHESIKNYWQSRKIMSECLEKTGVPEILGEKLLTKDVLLIKFLAEAVKENQQFLQKLKEFILLSRNHETNEELDRKTVTSAANAITILVAGNASFSGNDLSKIRICGANLKDGMFSNATFSEADLSNVLLENCKLDGSYCFKTNMDKVKLGIYPDIKTDSPVNSCCFSRNGEFILSGGDDGSINVWENSEERKNILSIGLLNNLDGHSSSVRSVCFSPNGNEILSGSFDRTIKIWDRNSGKLLKSFEGHSNFVFSVCFSSDGNLILSGGGDKTIKIWDRHTGLILKTYEGHTGSVRSVCFSPDDSLLLSGGEENLIKLWDRKSGELLTNFEGHTDSVLTVSFSPDGNLILSGAEDSTIKLWDRNSGLLLINFQGHSDSVRSVCFSSDGNQIISGSDDMTIKLWDRNTGLLLETFRGHSEPVRSVYFSPSGNQIVSSGGDTRIMFWDRTPGARLKHFEGHSDQVFSVCFSPDEKQILSGSCDKTIKLWDKNSGALMKNLEGHSSSVRSVSFSPDGSEILSGSSDMTVKLWNRSSGMLLKTFEGHSDIVLSVCFSPDGNQILSGSEDQTIKLWDKNTGVFLKTFESHSYSGWSVCFSPEGNQILTSADHTINLWDKNSAELLKSFEGHYGIVMSVCFSHNGNQILSGGGDKTIKLWDRNSGVLLKSFEGHSASVLSVCFSPHGNLIMSGSSDKTIKLWDPNSGELLKTFEGHSDWVWSVCFSTDGNEILSGSSDHTIKLWVRNSSAPLFFSGHSGSRLSVCISPDGNYILSGVEDKKINMWDRKSGALLKTFVGHSGSVHSICFSPDGHQILSVTNDKTIHLWDRNSGELLKSFVGYSDSMFSACFSPDGKQILSLAEDSTIKMWDRNSGALLMTFLGHSSTIRSVCFSPEGNQILSGSDDTTIKLWDKNSGKLLMTFEGHSGSVQSVCFSPDGNQIVSGADDTLSKLWDRNSGAHLINLEGHSGSILFVRFSLDGNLIFTADELIIRLWERKSYKLIFSFSRTHSIPLPIQMIFPQNLIDFNEFICQYTFCETETRFYCKNMILIDPISLSSGNSKVFLDQNAKIHFLKLD